MKRHTQPYTHIHGHTHEHTHTIAHTTHADTHTLEYTPTQNTQPHIIIHTLYSRTHTTYKHSTHVCTTAMKDSERTGNTSHKPKTQNWNNRKKRKPGKRVREKEGRGGETAMEGFYLDKQVSIMFDSLWIRRPPSSTSIWILNKFKI